MNLGGAPLMSPNCWDAIEGEVRRRDSCRYLEWGSGNSTLALLRAALEVDAERRLEINSIESDSRFAGALIDAIALTFREGDMDGQVSVEPLGYPKPSLRAVLGCDSAVARYEAKFLETLWLTRNDEFWKLSEQPRRAERGALGAVRRRMATARCSLAYRLEQARALVSPGPRPTPIPAGSAQHPAIDHLASPSVVTFETSTVLVRLHVAPRMSNLVWRQGPILDGTFKEFAAYVSVPLLGTFDVVLVDGRARTSCLKRVWYDQLLTPGGVLFVHDAHRPALQEALRLFGTWSFVRGQRAAPGGGGPSPPQVRSGTELDRGETTFDRELFFYGAPERRPDLESRFAFSDVSS
jgi:hypothetical protein